MDLVFQTKALKLIGQLFDRKNSTTGIIPFEAQKPVCASFQNRYFPRVAPEKEGISSEYIYDFLRELGENPRLDMHSIMILRNGRVICEADFGAYRKNVWHVTYSLCKSVTSLAIGLLWDEGLISFDEKLADIFPRRTKIISKMVQGDLTVENLLNMSTGVMFNEAGSVTETDWIGNFLTSISTFEAGKGFAYNSMNTYMLSAIIEEKTGKSVSEYLEERLFKPLEIKDVFWETCPKGIEKGGWGLYIRIEDVAKLGQLILNNGEWNGKQIVSLKYIAKATAKHNNSPKSYGEYNYGYQMWIGRKQNSVLFNGMFGQNMIAFRDTGIIIASNAGNDEFFQVSDFFDTVHKYFGEDFKPKNGRLHGGHIAARRLKSYEKKLARVNRNETENEIKRTRRFCERLDGEKYIFDHSETANIGMMPLYLQLAQNNHTKGIDSIAFSYRKNILTMSVSEGNVTQSFEVGTAQDAAYSEVSYNGEPYRVGSSCRLSYSEDDIPVLKIKAAFVETANVRTIKLFFTDDKNVRAEFSEKPGKDYLKNALECTVKDYKNIAVIEPLVAKLDSDVIDYRVKSTLVPAAMGRKG